MFAHRPPSHITRGLGALCLAAILFLGASAGPANAQSGSTQSPEAQSPLKLEGFQNWAQGLQQDGITFDGRYLGDFAADVAGGQRQGSAFAGELSLGSRVDLGKLGLIPGGSLHILFTLRNGNSLVAHDVNNSISVQEIYGGGETFQLTEFTYHQTLAGGKMEVQFGRTELDNYFAHADIYCEFENNAVCGQPFELVSTTNTTVYPIAGWGGHVTLKPWGNSYVMFGIYQDSPSVDTKSSHGFSWGLVGSNGFAVPIELGLKTTPPHSAYPDKLGVGVVFDRSSFTPPSGSGTRYGRTVPYAVAQGRLWQAAPGSERGLYGMMVGLVGLPEHEQTFNFGITGALVDRGPFPSRPNDNLGVSIAAFHAPAAELAARYTRRQIPPGSPGPDANLVMFELNYGAQLLPWLTVTPNFQYVLNPDGGSAYLPTPHHDLPNAVIVGLQFTVSLPSLLGIPGKNT